MLKNNIEVDVKVKCIEAETTQAKLAEEIGTTPSYVNRLIKKNEDKWYGLVMAVGRDKLGLDGEGMVDVLNVKCDPMLAGSLRQQDGFHPAYHMNKDKWLTARLDGSAPDDEIKSLIDLSYELTADKKKRKRQADE